MPLLQEKLRSDNNERAKIRQTIENAPIRPTKDEGAIAHKIMVSISEQFKFDISESGITPEIKDEIARIAEEECREMNLGYESRKKIERIVVTSVTGYGAIQPYIEDEDVTEIVVQRYDNICIERNGLIEKTDAAFASESQLLTIINRIVQPIGRQINIATPMVDARLEDGSRVNATIKPVTPDGATLTIRKFSNKAMTGEDYVSLGSISPQMLQFLSDCVRGKVSMLVSGGTNTGKTTLLNMLSSYIPQNELIITIEDSCELNLHQPNVRRMETRALTNNETLMPVTIQSLVKNSLRMRPDRIIVGEIRDGAIVDMMSAMGTGHEGSMSTVHANSPQDLIDNRIAILCGQNQNITFDKEARNKQIVGSINIIVQIKHMLDGKRRITHITAVNGIKDGEVSLKDIFRYSETKKEYYATGFIPQKIIDIMRSNGVNVDVSMFKQQSDIQQQINAVPTTDLFLTKKQEDTASVSKQQDVVVEPKRQEVDIQDVVETPVSNKTAPPPRKVSPLLAREVHNDSF